MFMRLAVIVAFVLALPTRGALAQTPDSVVPPAPGAEPTARATDVAGETLWRVPVGSSPVRGPKHALVTVVVFSDFECGFCRRHAETLEAIARRYPKDVRIVFKHRPLPFHPMATPAAHLAAEALARGRHKTFWQVHDALFAAEELSPARFEAIARDAGLDAKRTLTAVDAQAHEETLAADEELADAVGANGTPTTYVNGIKVSGARPLEQFVPVIDRALEAARRLRAAGTPAATLYETLVKNGQSIEPEFERRSVPEPSVVQPLRGPARAPVTIHIFTDFECPYCGLVQDTLRKVERRYAKQVRFAYHSLPLSFHPHARDAAALALEAFAQQGSDGFWRAHDRLFANQRSLTRPELIDHARALGLDAQRVEAALADGRHNLAIDTDLQLASDAGINGTPNFVINGYEVAGAVPFAAFRQVIDRALKEATSSPTKPQAHPPKR